MTSHWIRSLTGLALILALGISPAFAGTPIEEARQMVDDGKKLLDDADKAKRDKGAMLAEGLKKYARAYLLITGRKLQNDAPDLLQEISDQIARVNAMPEVTVMRQELLAKAVDAATGGKLTEAYDHLANLRDLDPREWTVTYALEVIGQNMEGG